MDAKTTNELYGQAKAFFLRCVELFGLHCTRLVVAIRENFIPEEGASGIRAVYSRFTNLWGSGAYGKSAIVIALLITIVFMSNVGKDDGMFIPQSGNHPKEWYDRCEEEPYGIVGFKGISPVGKDKNGVLIFSSIPALSEVKSAFCVDFCYGLGFDNSANIYYFPPASDRAGRIAACKNYQQRMVDMRRDFAAREARRNFNNMMFDLEMQSREAELDAESRRIDIQNKMRAISDRQHDYDMSRASGMSLNQWDTYKRTPDAALMDKNGVYKGADGDMYQIDINGNKWWINDGNRVLVQ